MKREHRRFYAKAKKARTNTVCKRSYFPPVFAGYSTPPKVKSNVEP